MLAQFRIAATQAENKDFDAAEASYLALSTDPDVKPLYQQAAILLSVMNAPASRKHDELAARLTDLESQAGPWQSMALEQAAGLALRSGDRKAAMTKYESLAGLSDIPSWGASTGASDAANSKRLMDNAWRIAPCLYLKSMNLAKQYWFQMHARGVVMTVKEILMNGLSLLRPLSSVLGKSLLAGFVVLALSACSESELILDGDRVAIITTSDMIAADPAALAEGAGLPDVIDILNAGHPGLSAGHTGGNVKASLPFKRAWRASIGGSGDSLTELAQPMVAGEQVFTVAPNGKVTAFDIKTGKANWQVSVEEFTDDPLPGIAGGLAVRGEDIICSCWRAQSGGVVGAGWINNMVNITAFSGSWWANDNRARSRCRN